MRMRYRFEVSSLRLQPNYSLKFQLGQEAGRFLAVRRHRSNLFTKSIYGCNLVLDSRKHY